MISIISPFFNEKENLKELYNRLLKITPQLEEDWEIIFVNDGSTDGGGEDLRFFEEGGEGGGGRGTVRQLELSRRYGLTTALYAGFQASRGGILATLDSDLQNPPEEIPRLLGFLKEVEMVTGIRTRRQDGWLKRGSSKLANGIRRFVLGDHIEDVGCSLRVFRRQVLECFYPYQGIHRFFPALAELHGFKVKQVAVEHHPRRGGRSKYGFSNRALQTVGDLFAIRWLLTKKIDYQLKEGGG